MFKIQEIQENGKNGNDYTKENDKIKVLVKNKGVWEWEGKIICFINAALDSSNYYT